MDEQGLPVALRCRLRSFFLQNRHQAQHVTRQKLLENLSPQLHAEVCAPESLVDFAWPMALRYCLEPALDSEGHLLPPPGSGSILYSGALRSIHGPRGDAGDGGRPHGAFSSLHCRHQPRAFGGRLRAEGRAPRPQD